MAKSLVKKMNFINVSKSFNPTKTIFFKSHATCPPAVSGLVLGVYDSQDGVQELTEAGEQLNQQTSGYLKEILKQQHIPLGKAEVFSGLGIQGFTHLALAGLGPKDPKKLNLYEQLNEEKENIRVAMAVGARGVQDSGANRIFVDGVTVPEAAAEGSILATYKYKANVSTGDKYNPQVELFQHPDTNSWASGEINAESQNWARYLSHMPPNLKKLDILTNEIIEKVCKFDIRIDIRPREWMVLRNMHGTLSLTKGSCQPPMLLELGYCGDDPLERPIVFVGKGNIFDSGGLFLKPYKGIKDFRADMAGAAAIVGTMLAVARKRLPINIRGLLLLYENMPSPTGTKPGDIMKDRRGYHIRLSDPDNDCRVVLSDIVDYAGNYKPVLIIDVGTFTRSSADVMGIAATAAFTPSLGIWNEIQRAGLETGDRFWRFPLWKYFSKLIKNHRSVDLDNVTHSKGGDCCQAAAFLRDFVPRDQVCCCPQQIPFLHLDNFGTGLLDQTTEEIEPYYRKGIKMGRPTRGLIQFIYHRACLLPKQKPTNK